MTDVLNETVPFYLFFYSFFFFFLTLLKDPGFEVYDSEVPAYA